MDTNNCQYCVGCIRGATELYRAAWVNICLPAGCMDVGYCIVCACKPHSQNACLKAVQPFPEWRSATCTCRPELSGAHCPPHALEYIAYWGAGVVKQLGGRAIGLVFIGGGPIYRTGFLCQRVGVE